jgi:hypothetical protein
MVAVSDEDMTRISYGKTSPLRTHVVQRLQHLSQGLEIPLPDIVMVKASSHGRTRPMHPDIRSTWTGDVEVSERAARKLPDLSARRVPWMRTSDLQMMMIVR